MPDDRNAPVSRPSRLTVEVTDTLAAGLADGLYLDDAARLAGIAPSTLYGWLRRGRDAEAQRDAGGELPPADRPFVELLESVERARASAKRDALGTIRAAAHNGSWQAAAWYLERTAPDKYGRTPGPRHPMNAEPSPIADAQRAHQLEHAAAEAVHTEAVLFASLAGLS